MANTELKSAELISHEGLGKLRADARTPPRYQTVKTKIAVEAFTTKTTIEKSATSINIRL